MTNTTNDFSTVSTVGGYKSHYTQDGKLTLCGREVSNGTSGHDMCKTCIKRAEKIKDHNDRTAYAARAAETQDDVMQAAPVEPCADWEREVNETGTVALSPAVHIMCQDCRVRPADVFDADAPMCGVCVGDVQPSEDVFDMANLTPAQITVLETNIGRVPETIAAAREINSDNRTTAWAHAGRYYVPGTLTLRADVDPAAYSSAVHNANDTAREEGWTRLSPAWFTCLDYSYESMRVENEDVRQRAAFYAEQDAETAALDAAAPVYCPNCTQSHPAEDVELHAAPCFVCAGDGHSGCQHGDDAPAEDETHAIRYMGDDMTMCHAPVKGMDGIKRVSVDPSDVTCQDCITAERHVAELDANTGPTDDEINAEILAALDVAERRLTTAEPLCVHGNRSDCATCAQEAETAADLPLTLSLTPTANGRLVARVGAFEKLFRDDRTAKMHAAWWAREKGARGNGKGGRFDWHRAGHGVSVAPAHFG